MVLHLPIGPWNRYRDSNPVPASPLADDIATTPSGPVEQVSLTFVISNISPVHGEWSTWSETGTGPCSVTCGPEVGYQFVTYSRKCNSSAATDGGQRCLGNVSMNTTKTCRANVTCHRELRFLSIYLFLLPSFLSFFLSFHFFFIPTCFCFTFFCFSLILYFFPTFPFSLLLLLLLL